MLNWDSRIVSNRSWSTMSNAALKSNATNAVTSWDSIPFFPVELTWHTICIDFSAISDFLKHHHHQGSSHLIISKLMHYFQLSRAEVITLLCSCGIVVVVGIAVVVGTVCSLFSLLVCKLVNCTTVTVLVLVSSNFEPVCKHVICVYTFIY